ncbi:MAG: UDP-N-acetylmuramate--L-alanine ligase [Anaerolineae bacterium]
MSRKIHPGQHIHLVGIGGSGLSAIARVLLGQGYTVSGSDRSTNELTDALARDGATIYKGHDAANVQGADALIITSAVKDDHVEVAAARAAGIPVYKRQDMMSDLMEGKRVIAVAGTKGKTTTTAMIVHILRECGQDPSYIVGGIMGNTGTNAGVGQGECFVVEADEYDNMFLGLRPDIAVITNIEWDHPDFFKTPDDMVEAFEKFTQRIPLYGSIGGTLVGCADDTNARRLLDEIAIRNTTRRIGIIGAVGYSANEAKCLTRTYYAVNTRSDENGNIRFDIETTFEKTRGYVDSVNLGLPGRHNVQNALAAIIVSNEATHSFRMKERTPTPVTQAAKALESFKPTARRFELRADLHRIAIIDDYAHNPMSIRAVLEAARQRYPDRAVWAVWQPHTYSRVQALFKDFVTSFAQADHILVTDIYAAREAPMPGVTSAALVAAMSHPDVRHTPSFADAVAVLSAEVQAPAVVVIMSAGDAPAIGIDYLKDLQARQDD